MSYSYQSQRVSSDSSSPSEDSPLLQNTKIGKGLQYNILYGVVFISSFVFYTYCIYSTFSPLVINGNHASRRLEEESAECVGSHIGKGTAIGLAAGAAVVAGGLLLVGLSPIGPVAGGYFAANMGAGLTAGSMMAGLQSAAMSGVTYATGAGIGAVTGAGIGASVPCN